MLEESQDSGDMSEVERIKKLLESGKQYAYDLISPYILDRYFVVITGFENDGKPIYWKMRKNDWMNPIITLFEDYTYTNVTGRRLGNSSQNSFWEWLPFTPESTSDQNIHLRRFKNSLPPGLGSVEDFITQQPMVNFLLKWSADYDAFRNKSIYSDKDILEGWNQVDNIMGTEDSFLRDLSEKLSDWGIPGFENGFDVRKTKSMLGSIFTNLDNNKFYQMFDATYKSLFEGLSIEEQKEFKNKFGRWVHDITSGISKDFYGEIDMNSETRNKNEIQILADDINKQSANKKAIRRKSVKEALEYYNYEEAKDSDGSIYYRNKTTGEHLPKDISLIDREIIELAKRTFIKGMGIEDKVNDLESREMLTETFNEQTEDYIIRGFKNMITSLEKGIKSPGLEDAMERFERGEYESAALMLFHEWKFNLETKGEGANEELFREINDLKYDWSDNEVFNRAYEKLLESYKTKEDIEFTPGE